MTQTAISGPHFSHATAFFVAAPPFSTMSGIETLMSGTILALPIKRNAKEE